MQGSGLPGSGGSHTHDDAVRLLGDFLDLAEVPLGHVEFVDGDGFAGREDTHDDVFVEPGGRNGGHAQFDLLGSHHVLDLAVLRFPPLGNVQARHDLVPGDERAAIRGGDLVVFVAASVHAEANDALSLLAVRLDVDVRNPGLVGVGDDLVGQADDGAIVLVHNLGAHIIRLLRLRFVHQFAHDIGEGAALSGGRIGLAGGGVDVLQDVLAQPDHKLDRATREDPLDVLDAIQVIGVVDEDLNPVLFPLQRNPEIVL